MTKSLFATLSLIDDIHHAGYAQPLSPRDHLDVIFDSLKTRPLSQEILLRMSALTQSNFPENFPLCSFFATTSWVSLFTSFCHRNPPSAQANFDVFGFVFGAVVYQDSSIFDFLVQCSTSGWLDAFAMIDRVCDVTGKDAGHFEAIFINSMLTLIGDGTCGVPTEFFEITWFFLFFRRGQTHSLPLRVLAGLPEVRLPQPVATTSIVDK
jgi:hypothetical protein